MDKGGVAAAMISITNPGLWFGDKEATRRIARECNEYGAKLVQQHPTRFGLFCALPLPDVDATLQEIEYAFDTLKCDGAHFMTSYGDTWIGNPAYEPVMAELHRRKAVVHVHPTAANCCKNLIPGHRAGPYGIRHRHHARDHERDVERPGGEILRYSLHLVPCRRHRAVPRRPHRWRLGAISRTKCRKAPCTR